MMIWEFSVARLPRIEFGAGRLGRLPELISSCGTHALLVTGQSSFEQMPQKARLEAQMQTRGIEWERCTVSGEPSPSLVDEAVHVYAERPVDVVVGIGGGSALDTAKAIAGLLRTGRSVIDYLEGVGPERPYTGPALPFIAVPTTAGTGSEATKNAVLSVRGPGGFKKSFRHDRLVAEYAVVDPELLSTCPREVIAANGMDALTQLIESYTSTRSGVLTDALAVSGLRAARDGLLPWFGQGPEAIGARERMAYAALISGITLAQTGLGSVHGMAAPLGAFYSAPHGVVCGTLVGEATEVNIKALLERDPDNPALEKYARLGDILCERKHRDRAQARQALVDLLHDWTRRLQLPRLSGFGLSATDVGRVVANSRGSSMQTNPIVLTDEELRDLVLRRL